MTTYIMKRLTLKLVVAAALICAGWPAMAEDDAVKAALEAASEVAAVSYKATLLADPSTPVLGNPKGDVVIVKFFDYQCPYCKAVEPKLEKLMMDDKGVKIVVKEFPILGPESVIASKAALASVRQGKYAAFHHALMTYRGQLTDEVIFTAAKSVGLDVDKLRKDMISPEVADQLLANFNLARALKVSVTPGYFIGTHELSGVSAKTSSGAIDFPAVVAAARTRKN